MGELTVAELIPVLQVAIGPAILVSGAGLLLLTMTNRLARVVDRSRALAGECRQALPEDRERLVNQVETLWVRAKLIRKAILLASVSVLLAALLVITLFVTALLRVEDAWLIGGLFVACMLSLVGSLAVFIRDVYRSLTVLKMELGEVAGER